MFCDPVRRNDFEPSHKYAQTCEFNCREHRPLPILNRMLSSAQRPILSLKWSKDETRKCHAQDPCNTTFNTWVKDSVRLIEIISASLISSRPMANISAVLFALKMNTQRHFVGALLRLAHIVSQRRHTQNPSTGGHDRVG